MASETEQIRELRVEVRDELTDRIMERIVSAQNAGLTIGKSGVISAQVSETIFIWLGVALAKHAEILRETDRQRALAREEAKRRRW